MAPAVTPKDLSDPTNVLSGKMETLDLDYIVWGCACPNWVTPADYGKYADNGLTKHCIYIEPASTRLEIPFAFDPFRHRIRVSGQFYVRPDYPKGTFQGEEVLDKAPVFRYDRMEVLYKPGLKFDSVVKSMTLTYNGIGCTCAQWSESRFDKDTAERIRYWLEPANKELMNADTLYNGTDLPVQIRVTGQVVTEYGFPLFVNLDKAGQEEAGRVFRYTKIELLKKGTVQLPAAKK